MLFFLAAWANTDVVVTFDERRQHRFHVAVSVEHDGGDLAFAIPTWTPGSYLQREFARHVEGVVARGADGTSLPITKVSKNRWVVEAGKQRAVRLDYDVYAAADHVRGSWVDADLAVLNGASSWLVPADRKGSYSIDVQRPDGWPDLVSAIPPIGSTIQVPDYDTLVDTPIVAGSVDRRSFEVGGVTHELVSFPPSPRWESAKAEDAVRRIVTEQHRFWGEVPYDRYVFLNWLADGRGGLEHSSSTLLMAFDDQTRDPEAFRRWQGLVSHELFHAWNGKRLRPVELGPFDYDRENYTRQLWLVEGVTSYYDDLLLVRAGLLDEAGWLERISRSVTEVAGGEGRKVQSLADASFDAWIKHYRPDENTRNATVNYYTKGAVVGWLLDARIRAATDGRASLDDAMRLARKRFPKGYTAPAFEALLSEVAGVDLAPDLQRWVHEPGDLVLTAALQTFGLTLALPAAPPEPWLGLTLEDGRITQVGRDGPAARAGLNVGDELLALDGLRVNANLEVLLRGHQVGDPVKVLVARRSRVLELNAVLGASPATQQVIRDPEASRRQERERRSWLGQ